MPVFFSAVINDHFEEIEDLNAEQLELGEDAKEDPLAKYRNPDYARFKKGMGSLSSPVADLKLTGKYHKAITVKKTGGAEYQIINTDSKFQELSEKYRDHLGISDRSKEIIAEDILIPGMHDEMEQWLQSRI